MKVSSVLCVFLSLFALSRATATKPPHNRYWIYCKNTQCAGLQDSLKAWTRSKNYHSEWLQAYSAKLDSEQLRKVLLFFPTVKVEQAGYFIPQSIKQSDLNTLGYALEQINAKAVIDMGLTAKDVKIGIIDGGFLNAPISKNLRHFFSENKVANYKDFITPKLTPYGGSKKLDDQHGTDVWEMIGGVNEEKKIQFGLATQATYYLARTDHGASEKRIEEEYFVQALEWFAEQGVKLVNTSLGYTNGYVNPKENYTPDQMDGSSAIAKATQYAIDQKGMIIVGAAGNDGKLPWKVVNTPADAPGVIAVGASKNKLLDKMGYSSIGPDYVDYVKPEVTCFSTAGTSFSTPVITGLLACMMQYKPSLTNKELKALLLSSCDLYPYGNNYIGYGNPDAAKMIDHLRTGKPILSKVITKRVRHRPLLPKKKIRIKPDGNTVIIYHKYDEWKVLERKLILSRKKKVSVTKHPKATQSTIIAGEQILEVFWQKK